MLADLVAEAEREAIFTPQAAYGYFKAAGDGNDLVLFAEDGRKELARFALPRQAKEGGLCVADFLRDVGEGQRDVLGLQVVTVGQRASEVAREWFAQNTRTTCGCTGWAWSWPRRWLSMSTPASAPSSASATRTHARCGCS